jgi:hypothetical protein
MGAEVADDHDCLFAADESEQRSQAATARPLGHQSSHQRAVRLTTPLGHRQARRRGQRRTRASTKAGVGLALTNDVLFAKVVFSSHDAA